MEEARLATGEELDVQTYTTAVNALCFDLGGVTVWFSYRTPVAFQVGASEPVVRQNAWGPTTGKHLNAIDGGDKRARVSGEQFQAALAKALKGEPIGA